MKIFNAKDGFSGRPEGSSVLFASGFGRTGMMRAGKAA